MQDEKSRGQLNWHKWFVEDAKAFKEVMDNEQMGELFFAIMETVETGERVNVSEYIKPIYLMYCVKVESARTAYKNKCENLAKNGSKGGKAKAENKANAKNENSFKPPSKTAFKEMVKHLEHEYNFKCSNYDIQDLYELLERLNWEILNRPITKKYQLEAYALIYLAKCTDGKFLFECGISLFKLTIDVCCDTVFDFYDCYDDNNEEWIIGNDTYTEIEEAAKAFLNRYDEC